MRAAPLFAPTLYETEPLPLPEEPLVTVTKETLLPAVQAQPAGAVTVTLPVPPEVPYDADVGETR